MAACQLRHPSDHLSHPPVLRTVEPDDAVITMSYGLGNRPPRQIIMLNCIRSL